MNMDDQYSQPPTYTTYLASDPPPPYIPPYVQATEPVRDFKQLLVSQMDGWLEELNDIDWTVKNAQPVPEYLPRYPGTDGTDQDQDSDLDSDQTLDHETESDAGENEDENNDTSPTHSDSMSVSSEDLSDDEDGCYEELSAVVNGGWARLRRIQDHMASFKHSLSEDSEFYNIVL
ncbi:uncharacterized protein APUU_30690S [Aspergillus puulaauensis]|uniref:Uncharacterized protein n=1 Tax=Aspergillus puulaauensis TaxID=1220207 RepID=A0A7R8AM94_9EURO|nr:uncharacterized protein APUU_30690S [Aspergillus puulaauensis]BCS22465.1 hypothetical protein APUU_30690S [Aspergillus puulaauensis]